MTSNIIAFDNIENQRKLLLEILNKSQEFSYVFNNLPKLKLPNWYLAAGAIPQIVWNYYHKYPLDNEIKDFDIVYFDKDTSRESENYFSKKASEVFKNIPIRVELVNEARVHLWYEEEFGYKIKPYKSTEHAIYTFPTNVTSIGLTLQKGEEAEIYAPYGLSDIFAMTVKPNKVLVKKENYEKRANRWKKAWPKLTIVPW